MTYVAPPPRPSGTRTIGQVIEEVADLSAGAAAVFLPFFIPAVPAIALVAVPVIAVGAVLAVAGALVALPLVAPYLLLRTIRGRRAARVRRPGNRDRQPAAPPADARPTATP